MAEHLRPSQSPESFDPERWDRVMSFSDDLIDSDPSKWWVVDNRRAHRVIAWFSGARRSDEAIVSKDRLVPISYYLIKSEGFLPIRRGFYGDGDIHDIDPKDPSYWLRVERFYPIFGEGTETVVVGRVDPYFMATVRNENATAEKFAYGPNLPLQHQTYPAQELPLPEINDPHERLARFYNL